MLVSKVKVGMKVKVNEYSDVIYTVDEMDGFNAKLSYITESGIKTKGFWIDVSAIPRKANKGELKNNGN